MRFTATALATILAVVVISGARPTLSGMSVMPPCEEEPKLPTIGTRPKAPTRLRIVPSAADLFENLSVSGPHAGPEMDYYEAATAVADPHGYYLALASRSDCVVAYSLRNAAQVQTYRAPKNVAQNMEYVYPNDPDPRRQDAMRIRIPEGSKGTAEQLRVPVGPTAGKSLLVTIDFWWGAEWNKNHSQLSIHKGTPLVLFRQGEVAFVGTRTDYTAARQHESNQPAGGPYVAMLYAQGTGKGAIVKTPSTWIDSMSGYPRLTLPYDAPPAERRTYVEGIAPVDTSVDPSGAEVGMIAERWHRLWLYFERTPAEDWVSTYSETLGAPMNAYRFSMWFADTVRPPFRVIKEAVVGIDSTLANQITEARIEIGAGNVNEPATYSGRGDLIAYTRNWVVLHGTQKSEVLAMLAKPVN